MIEEYSEHHVAAGLGRKTRFVLLLDFLKDMEDEVYVNPYTFRGR